MAQRVCKEGALTEINQPAGYSVNLFVRGEPKGQPRPRAFARNFGGGKWQARMYDAKTAEGWKSQIALAARGLFPYSLSGPVRLRLDFYMPRPKAHFRSNGQIKESAPSHHTSKPDCDNLSKAVMDCLTQLGAWHDDNQVSELRVTKRYTDEHSGCQIFISPAIAGEGV